MPRHRRRAGDRRRHAALARGRRARRGRRAAHDRRRPAGARARRAHLRGEPARVDEIVTVSDAEIVEAMVFLFDRLKLVVEPSGAVGVAALLAGTRRRAGGGSASSCRAATSAPRASPSWSLARSSRPPQDDLDDSVRSAAATSLLASGQPVEHPAAEQLVDAAVDDDRGDTRVEVDAELAAVDPAARSRAGSSSIGFTSSPIRSSTSALRAISRITTRTTSGWWSQLPRDDRRDVRGAGRRRARRSPRRSRSAREASLQFSRKIVSSTSSFDEK